MPLPPFFVCLLLFVVFAGAASAEVPRPQPNVAPIVQPEGDATLIKRPAVPIQSIAAPWLSLGNDLEACNRSARPGVDCMAGLVSGNGIIAVVHWVWDGLPVSVRQVDTYRILRVPRPEERPPAASGGKFRPAAGLKAKVGGVVVSEGPFKGSLAASAFGTSHFQDGVLLTGVQAGQCFVAVVEAGGRAGTVTAESPPSASTAASVGVLRPSWLGEAQRNSAPVPMNRATATSARS